MAAIPEGYRALLADKRLLRALPFFSISDIGDGVLLVAIPWAALQTAGGVSLGVAVSAALTAYTLPGAIVASWLSPWLSARAPAQLIALDAGLRAGLLALVPAVSGAGGLWWLVTLVGLSSLLHPWGLSGRRSLISRLGSGDAVVSGLSLVYGIRQLGLILGPAIGGVLIAASGYGLAFYADAGSFLILAVFAAGVQRGNEPASTARGIRLPTRAAFRAIFGDDTLRWLVILTATFYLTYGPIEVALPIFVTGTLGHGAGALALFSAAFAAGSVVGALISGGLRRAPRLSGVCGIVVAWGVFACGVAATTTTAVAVGSYAAGGVIFAPFATWSAVLVQHRVDAARTSAVYAVLLSLGLVATPGGIVIGGPLVGLLGARATILASGAATLLLGVLALARARPAGRARPGNGLDGAR